MDYANFNDPATGYQSTATLTPDFGGPPDLPIQWTVFSVTNVTGSFWMRPTNDQNGLTWGDTADGYSAWNTNGPEGTAPDGVTGKLTDIVGNRTVVVRAQAPVNGVPVPPRDMTINFGNGPLSVFSGAVNTSVAWGSNAAWDQFPFLPPTGMLAPAGCTGNTWNDNQYITAPNSSTVTFDPSYWSYFPLNSNQYYHAVNSKLPTFAQLLAVGARSSSIAPNSKGAARAAGWPMWPLFPSLYWTGALQYDQYGHQFIGLSVDLTTGAYYVHQAVTDGGMNAACVN